VDNEGLYAARFPERAREPVVSVSGSVDAIAAASSIHSRAILSRITRRTGSSVRSAASAHSRACFSYSLTSDDDTGVHLNQGSGLHCVAAGAFAVHWRSHFPGGIRFSPAFVLSRNVYGAVRRSSRGVGAMITSRQCRERAAECRQMAERAPNATVQERLAIQAAHSRTIVAADQMAFPFTAVQ
jgi:hypothetical protein